MDNEVITKLKMTDQGASSERRQHSRFSVGVAAINKGGHPTSFRHEDTEHCLLDRMFNMGFLGPNAHERHGQGLRLRELYYSFNVTGVSYEDMGSHKDMFTKEGEIGRGSDLDEWFYNATLKNIAEPYRSAVRRLCVFDEWSDLRTMQFGLDRLYSAFYEAEKAKKTLLEQINNKK